MQHGNGTEFLDGGVREKTSSESEGALQEVTSLKKMTWG